MKTRIKLVHCDTLSCEPILRRMPDGNLLCLSQCGDVTEPAPGNRVYAFKSGNNGETWQDMGLVYPETGEAVYITEVMILNNIIHAFLQVHSGRFLNTRCVLMQSYDNGQTWIDAGAPPHFPTFCFIRSMLQLNNDDIILPCQYYPISEQENARLVIANHNIKNAMQQKCIWDADIDHLENNLIISADNGKTFDLFKGPEIKIKGDTGKGWVWTEPTLTQLSNGRIVMLLRVDGTGYLWRSESQDNGRTWTEAVKTDIPNPGNKPKLISLSDGRHALIHTPSHDSRYPLSIWISDNDLKTFSEKHVVTDFPGSYSYADGFYEDGHIMFTIEINRHEILFFDCEI